MFEDSADGKENVSLISMFVKPWDDIQVGTPPLASRCTTRTHAQLCVSFGLAHAEGESAVPGKDDLQLTAVLLSLAAMSVCIALGLPEPPLQLEDRRSDFRSLGINTIE